MQISNISQSKEWEEVEKSLGNKTFWIDNTLIIKKLLPRGMSYFFCPRGPEELTEDFARKAIELAKNEMAIFIRIEPRTLNPISYTLVKSINLNPANTLVLDLNKTEEQLSSEMKQKTRYNINLAKKKGVEIEVSSDPQKVDDFFKIMEQTSKRDGFGIHDIDHYKKLVEVLGPRGMIKVYLAKFEGRYIAGNIVSFFGNTVSYLHGASANEYRNVMAPYLLQWQAITDAKKSGFQYYDFWGIAPNDNPKHSWAGVTRFKKSFGGEQLSFPGTYDIVVSKLRYSAYKILRFLNRLF